MISIIEEIAIKYDIDFEFAKAIFDDLCDRGLYRDLINNFDKLYNLETLYNRYYSQFENVQQL